MTAVSSQPVRGSRFPTLEKYDVLEELGHGGMATVYRARDLRLGRDVAVKVIHPHLRNSEEAVRRFSIEARAVAKLRHANIVEVYDVSAPTESEQYLVVELLRGVTLRRLIELHGPLPAEIAASICVELLGALAHAHEAGVIHRDVKPENVIIEHRPADAPRLPKQEGASASLRPFSQSPLPSGTVGSPSAPAVTSSKPPGTDTPGDRIRIKLTDFGIAKLLDAQGVTSTGQVLGSPAHMAPEQIEGREVDGRADVFGIGVLLYECMVGHLPFQGTNPAQVLRRVLEGEYPSAERESPTVGRLWSRILDEALSPTVDERFAGAPEMRDALVRELARLGVSSPRGEIEAWLDDPVAFAVAHRAKMPAQLCAKGDEAAQRGDPLTAAADYNRALAYAPHDAALLKIVARMNRRRAQSDVLRRVWPYLAVCVLVAGGVGAARVRAIRRAKALGASMAATVPSPSLPNSTLEPASLEEPATVSVASMSRPAAEPEVAASARTLAHPTVGPHSSSASSRAQTREVHFAAVEPPQGVLFSIDGSPTSALDPVKGIVLDEKAHTLTFSCIENLCDTVVRPVSAGERNVTLSVHLTIKPAKFVIHGVAGNHYFLADEANHTLSTGDLFPNVILMTQSAVRVVRVSELETGRAITVELHAGRMLEQPVDFMTPR